MLGLVTVKLMLVPVNRISFSFVYKIHMSVFPISFYRRALFEEDAYTCTRGTFCFVVVFNHLKCCLVIPTVIVIVKRKGISLETSCGNTTGRYSALIWMKLHTTELPCSISSKGACLQSLLAIESQGDQCLPN